MPVKRRPWQVLPSLKKSLVPSWDLSETDALENSVKMQQAMTEAPATAISKSRQDKQGTAKATVNLIKGLDHSLQVAGLSLQHFQSDEQAAHSMLLRGGEMRYMVNCAEAWGDFAIPVDAPWKRSAVKNVVTGEKRFEVPSAWSENTPKLLVLSGDEASTNLAAFHWLSCGAHVRCVFFRDTAHRTWNDCKLALQETHLWGTVLETLQVMQTKHGPWKSGAWYRQLQEAAETHMKAATAGDPLFMHLYEHLAEDFRQQLKEPAGSSAQVAEVWDLLLASKNLMAKGSRVSMTRWFEWCAQFQLLDQEYHAHQFYYVLLGLHSGLWKSVSGAPVYDVVVSSHKLKRQKKTSQKPVPDASMQEAKQQAETADAIRCRNSVELACYLLGQPSMKRLSRMIFLCLKPFWSSFGKELKHVTQREGCFRMQLSFFLHQYSLQQCNVWRVLANVEALKHMGFALHTSSMKHYAEKMSQAAGAASSSSAQSLQAFHFEALPEDAFHEFQAQKLWQLVCGLCRHRSMSMAQWRCVPPYQFIGLLASGAANVKEAMDMQKDNWLTLTTCEKAQFTNPELQAILCDLPWLHNPVSREVLTMLAQHDFACIPAPAKSLLVAMFKGPNHSVSVENMFQHLQDFSRDAQNGMQSRPKRMHHCIQSSLLSEFDLPEVPAFAAQAEHDARRLHKSTWDGVAGSCSFSEELLKELQSKAGKAFPSPSAQSIQQQTGSWVLLVECCKQQCLDKIPEAWHALLMPQDHIAVHKPSSEFFVVLKSTKHAVLLWPVDNKRACGVETFQPRTTQGTRAIWRAILVPGDWTIVPTVALPPHVMRACFQHELGHLGIVMAQSDPEQTLWQAAARSGFAGVTAEYLKKMMAELKICEGMPNKDHPKTVLAIVEALIKSVLPDISDEELGRIVLERAGLRKAASTSLLVQGENAELTAPALESNDAEEISKYKKEQCANTTLKSGTLHWLKTKKYINDDEFKSHMSRLGLRSSVEEPPAKKQRTVPSKGPWSWQEKALKERVPAGSTIQEVINAHTTCWTGRYPNAGPGQQKSCTRSYGNHLRSSNQAAHLVFQWLWRTHQANGGEACPYTYPEESCR